jgi:hypothetical protein
MRRMASLAIAGILASATVLGGGSEPQPATAGADTAIRAIADQYVKATLAGDAKAIAALYTDDAVEMPRRWSSTTRSSSRPGKSPSSR